MSNSACSLPISASIPSGKPVRIAPTLFLSLLRPPLSTGLSPLRWNRSVRAAEPLFLLLPPDPHLPAAISGVTVDLILRLRCPRMLVLVLVRSLLIPIPIPMPIRPCPVWIYRSGVWVVAPPPLLRTRLRRHLRFCARHSCNLPRRCFRLRDS